MFFQKKRVDSLRTRIPRQELVRRSRILVIDDERPDLIDDLIDAGFSVNYESDIGASDLKMIDQHHYDLILLDFGDVGASFGPDQGLSLLKHIKRVNAAAIVFAYTSKALETKYADFYRLADGVLAKDAGIQESLERIEEGLQESHRIENQWSALLKHCNIEPGSKQDIEWQNLFVRGLGSARHLARLKTKVQNVLDSDAASTVGLAIIVKLVELGMQSLMGG